MRSGSEELMVQQSGKRNTSDRVMEGGRDSGNSKQPDGGENRLNNRLQATVAGLQELDILRQRQQKMVGEVRKMLQTSSSSISSSSNNKRKSRRRPSETAVVNRLSTIADEKEVGPASVPHSCPECDLLKVRQSMRISRDLDNTSVIITGPDHLAQAGIRRSSDPSNILTEQRQRRLQQQRATKRFFSLPREFSGTTYSFPSPMHAVLLQYHWTTGSSSNANDGEPPASALGHQNFFPPTEEEKWPSLRIRGHQWSSEINNPSEHTKMLGLPFLFLREQIKPANNSLESLTSSGTLTSEQTAEDAEKEDTLSSMSSLSSRSTVSLSSRSSSSSLKLTRFSLCSSLEEEEGYFSRPETPSSAGNMHYRRPSGGSTSSQSEASSVTSTGSEDIAGTELDLPESFMLLERGLKPTRLTGFDDSWVDELGRLPQLRDSVL